ncbi:ABC transporter ATP-binding protein [Clostridium sp. Marseille-P299]|uniref:ABC transporter ATP-binding protein n=1 Tax=Clostridium sp. Marseille-P299 TaxID=1805477 RepID=UPI00082B68D5|nr:ABC transporter ATP-binding protein [Clostridium sp. Marseille-P299]
MENVKRVNSMANNWYIISFLWGICPGRVIADIIMKAIHYASWVFYGVFFIRTTFQYIESGKSYSQIISFIVISALIFGILNIFGQWYKGIYRNQTDVVIYEQINKKLFDKAREVELECYEDVAFYNKYTLAMKDAEVRIVSSLETIADIIFGIIAAIVVLLMMYEVDHFVSLFVISPFIGNFVFGKWLNKRIFQKSKSSIPYQREMDYVNRTLYLEEYAKEIRMSNIFRVLEGIYEHGYKEVVKINDKFANSFIQLAVVKNVFSFLVIFQGVLFYSVYKTMVVKSMDLSSFIVLSSAMVSASWILIGLSNNIVLSLENALFIDNLRSFLNYQPKLSEDQDGVIPETSKAELCFQDVCFRYRGSKEKVLKNINFKIHTGEKIAIVGVNGAGKTTFIKLLMRLYDVTNGKILYNNVDIKEYNLKKYRQVFTTAFQDYQVFAMSVAENVLLRRPQNQQDYDLVKKALIQVGIYEKVMTLQKGMDTVLTKEFDSTGAVLSGGEKQKIAVARAFVSNSNVAIFDEPTSALDPIAEYRLYESIMEVCKDKTIIFISHRLSSTVLADTIYLFDAGQIIEQGNHKELMTKNGVYADMFKRQAESYQEGVNL